MSILDLLKKLFPFLVSAAEKTFDQLDEAVQTAGINGSLFAQIIKENTHALADDIRALVKSKLNLSDAQLTDLELQLVVKYNIPTEQNIYEFLQDKFNNVADDILHNSLSTEIMALVGFTLSQGKLTWLTLLMGVGEYIYRKFVKGQVVALSSAPEQTCNGVTKPKTAPEGAGINGHYICKSTGWFWVEDIG